MRIRQWEAAKTVLLCVGMMLAGIMPLAARAGLSDCIVQSAQLAEPESESIIPVHPFNFAINDYIGGHRYFVVTYNCQIDSPSTTRWGMREHHLSTTINTGLILDDAHVFTTAEWQTYGIGFMGTYNQRDHWPAGVRRFDNQNKDTYAYLNVRPQDIVGNRVDLRAEMIFRLVKINNNFDALVDTTTVTSYPLPFPIAATSIADDQGYVSPVAHMTANISILNIMRRTCTPFGQKTVQLPSVDAAELPNIGDTGNTTDFNITVRCPFNMARYGYYVESVHGYEDEPNGVIKIDPASTAKGIGLQVTTRSQADPVSVERDSGGMLPNHQPFKFGPTNRYGIANIRNADWSGTPATNEANYVFPRNNVPLKVAVYRTGGSLVAGSYTAGLTVYMVYR